MAWLGLAATRCTSGFIVDVYAEMLVLFGASEKEAVAFFKFFLLIKMYGC